MPTARPARSIACAFALAALSAAAPAIAGTTPAELYDQALAAEDRGRHDEAARLFARADAAAPSAGALAAALEAALRGSDAALAMELVDRAGARGARGRLAKLADAARRRFGSRVGRIETSCGTCAITIDGRSRAPAASHWAQAGERTVEITGPKGAVAQRTVRVIAGQAVTVEPPAPPPPPPPEPVAPKESAAPPPETAPSPPGISQAWFWVGVAATGGLAAGAGLSAKDAAGKRDAVESKPTAGNVRAQQTAEVRTIVLAASTGVLAAATLGMGIFGVRWRDQPAQVSAAVAPGGGMVVVTGRF